MLLLIFEGIATSFLCFLFVPLGPTSLLKPVCNYIQRSYKLGMKTKWLKSKVPFELKLAYRTAKSSFECRFYDHEAAECVVFVQAQSLFDLVKC